MLADQTACPVRWSIVDGTPKPSARTSPSSSDSTRSSISARSASSDVLFVGTSRWRTMVPSRFITPPKSFVPPASTPMTSGSDTTAGYHTAPDGGRRKTLPPVSGRARPWRGPDSRAPPPAPRRRSPRTEARQAREAEASAAPPHARPRDPERRPPADPAARRLGGRELARVRPRGGRGESAPEPPCESDARPARGPAHVTSDDDVADGHRPRRAGRPRGREPLRLDHAGAHRPGQAPNHVPVDPARPPRRHPGPRDGEDQRRVRVGRSGARDAHDHRRHGPRGQPRRARRLQLLPRPDRRARRRHRKRPGPDRLEPLRLPVPDQLAVPELAGLAVRQGQAEARRPPRADLLPHPRESAEPGRERPDPRRAPAGCRPGDRRPADEPDHAVQAALRRRRPAQAARDGPHFGAVPSAGVDEGSLARGPDTPLPSGR